MPHLMQTVSGREQLLAGVWFKRAQQIGYIFLKEAFSFAISWTPKVLGKIYNPQKCVLFFFSLFLFSFFSLLYVVYSFFCFVFLLIEEDKYIKKPQLYILKGQKTKHDSDSNWSFWPEVSYYYFHLFIYFFWKRQKTWIEQNSFWRLHDCSLSSWILNYNTSYCFLLITREQR